jgi:hypothetical protein
VAFDGSAAPGPGEPGGDRVLVAVQPSDEGPQRWWAIGVDGRHPRLQLLTTSGTHDGGEGADVTGQRGQVWAGGGAASSFCWSVSFMFGGLVMILPATRRTDGGFGAGWGMLAVARNWCR